ncbi:hypothetical protein, variant [Verruconis gallopava]|uniref:Uncharacterized protein n=1 Tax=Verruconis gallopava TaxID=253628 RepID=A0A0D2A646_9PEZI|nr:uncharacterized protein PV09_06372 [Verruconis gallopava]XP_016212087.1 hypothetical protein, variant [Verruconis gallopava]KIW02217.1 hypothetical protein PV09_06372 [Verruconis gallopava]KIW02218.1 hypothetical protein, variant [Verruconis gallopava]
MQHEDGREGVRHSAKRRRLSPTMDLWRKEATTSCLLFRLPREVRDVIYGHFFHENCAQIVKAGGMDALKLDCAVKVLRAVDENGRVQREATELYFRTRTLVFDSPGCVSEFHTTVERMKLRSFDVYGELRQVEIVGWLPIRTVAVEDPLFQWAWTRNFVRACIKHLTQCTRLNTVKICLDAEHFHLEDVRPIFGRVDGQILFEIIVDEKIEKKCLPGTTGSLRRLADVDKVLARIGRTGTWKDVSPELEDTKEERGFH